MIELMVEDLGADAQKQQVAIENNDLHRTTALYDSQSMDDLRSQWRYSSQFVWLLCLFLSHARTRLAKSNFLTTNLMISAE
jgi:hypothetical protein